MSDWKNNRPPSWEEIVDARIKKVNDFPIIHIGIRDNFEAGADAIEPLARKDERERILTKFTVVGGYVGGGTLGTKYIRLEMKLSDWQALKESK